MLRDIITGYASARQSAFCRVHDPPSAFLRHFGDDFSIGREVNCLSMGCINGFVVVVARVFHTPTLVAVRDEGQLDSTN